MVSPQRVVTHSPVPEPWQTQTLPLSPSVLGSSLVAGLLALSSAILWLRIRRLTRLIKRRDRQLKTLSFLDPLTKLPNRQRLESIGNALLSEKSVEVSSPVLTLLYLDLDRFKTINDVFGHEVGDALLVRIGDRLHVTLRPQDVLARIGGDEFVLLVVGDHRPARHSPGYGLQKYSLQRSGSQGQPMSESCPSVLHTSGRHTLRQHTSGRHTSAHRASDVGCRYAQQVLQALSEPFYVHGQWVRISGSIGIATATEQTTHVNQLLGQANIALSQAKLAQATPESCVSEARTYVQGMVRGHGGHSHYAVFHPLMQAAVLSQAQLRQALPGAIAKEELRVCYQPIVDLESNKTVGFEALVRWQHPQRGLLLPSDFLPLAEEMNLTVAIDRWVMETACRQLSRWRKQPPGEERPSLSVNLSANHLLQPDLVTYVQDLLAQYPIAPHQLNLEITESVMITDPEGAIETLQRLRQLDVCISLDDFGTGYSSLGYLLQFPVDVLKIDRSFVSCLGMRAIYTQEAQDEVIIKAILSLADDLNIRVVAEGIECNRQLEQLRQLRCSYGQGNLFSRPISAPLTHEILAKGA